MKRIAIVEDEKEYQDILTGFLKRYEEENGDCFQISCYLDGLDFVEEYISQYEIILSQGIHGSIDRLHRRRKLCLKQHCLPCRGF